ncbi:MFS transporter [Aquimarina sp. 2304DJ70-9]|uniref:MFS transporter n=1 Tax=Aquimarina penaris TaxID=3231044 RepID=UPI003462413F
MIKNLDYPKKRWFMLTILILVTIMVEIQWLTHAPIARVAQKFYENQLGFYPWLTIDTLAVVYMFVFVIICLPASYIIDTYGIKTGIGIGAILLIIGSIIKGFSGYNFLTVFIGQLFLATAQPFIINAVTAFSARWFPLRERAMAVGFTALAQYLGIVMVMLITPMLVVNSPDDPNYGEGIDLMLVMYMIPSVLSGILILLFLEEKPEHIPFNHQKTRLNFKKGLVHMLQLKDAMLTILLFTIGLGIFNAISTLVDSITANLNIKDSDGLIGGVMLIGGIVGAIILPILSDKYQKRKPFLVFCMLGVIPAIIGLAYAVEISGLLKLTTNGTYNLALASSFLLGFCIMSAGPIGFQYTAEITSPTPESTSQGILLLVGQISGIALVALMGMQDNMYLSSMMKLFVLLSIIAFIAILFIKESPIKSLVKDYQQIN